MHIVKVLFVTSLFACILSFHNVVARYVFTLSNRKVFPDRLGDAHEATRSPHLASGVDAVIVALVILVGISVRARPGDAVLHLAGRHLDGRHHHPADRDDRCGAGVLRAPHARPDSWRYRSPRAFIAPGLGLVGLVVAFGLILQNLPGTWSAIRRPSPSV